MAHGPLPKDPSQRARRNKPTELRVINASPVAQPDLPTFEIEVDDEFTEFVWPARTQEWWRMWADSPLSAEFTSTDWSELMDTALLHAKFWKSGSVSLAAELRQRVSNFGATPADRARLRITFAAAEEADARRDAQPKARDRYGKLSSAG